jgi:hypothetical protein
VATGKERLRFDTKGFYSFAWSAKARLLATPDFEHVYIWDAATGKQVFQIDLRGGRVHFDSCALAPNSKILALGMNDTSILAWNLPPASSQESLRLGALDHKKAEGLWADLASPDAGKAHQAIWTLVVAGNKAIPFLEGWLSPVAEKELQSIGRWIADLDSSKFAVRKAADESLRRERFEAEPALREALGRKPSLEVRQRLEFILAAPFREEPCESLGRLRCIEALEYIGGEQGRQLLEKVARGAPKARLTQEAKASLERLGRQPGQANESRSGSGLWP